MTEVWNIEKSYTGIGTDGAIVSSGRMRAVYFQNIDAFIRRRR
jgi:hypothetical protein